MKGKKILVTVLAIVILFVCALTIAFLMMPGLSYAVLGIGQPPYGRGVTGGYANPGNASATPAAGYGPGMMGRGMMGGPGNAPAGYTPPSGGTGGLVAVTADGKTVPAPSDAPQLPANTATQKIGNLNVMLAITPYPPVSFQNGGFDITLTDDKGQAVTDATISLDLTMPGMWMPPSKPNAQAIGNGKYHAAAFWTMRGLWQIEVTITRGNQKQSAFFDVWL